MSIDTISDFIAQIDAIGELVRITHPVRAELEICEIADRVMKSANGGPALLFEHVLLKDGSRSAYPVAINLFGSMKRMALSLGVTDLDDIGARITELVQMKVPDGLMGKLSMLPKLLEIGKFPPRVKGGAGAFAAGGMEGRGHRPVASCRSSRAGPRMAARTSRCRW